MKKISNLVNLILLTSCVCLAPLTAWAVAPEIVPTFENLGISWAPANRGSSQQAKVQYRVQGSINWRNAQDLWYDNRGGNYVNEYRGSIVNLNSGTGYEIKLTLSPNGETATASASTWREVFPVGTTVELPPVTNGTYTINQSGSPGAYRLYTFGSSGSAVVNAGRSNNYGIAVAEGVHHVIIRGLTVTGALEHGIFIDTATHDIIIEDNDISDWGAAHDGTYMCGWAVCDFRFAIGSTGSNWPEPGGERLIIQRNTIHDPAGDANSWQHGHPEGPQAIGIFNSPGNNVIRYNTVYSDDNHKYNDIFGWGDNMKGERGFPGPNSDIYGNRISDSWEDGIEAEGSGENVRIWGNYIDKTFTGVATVTLDQGPMYVWRNVFNKSRKFDISENSDSDSGYGRGFVFKVGNSNGYGGGKLYIYHNTLLQEEPNAPYTKPLGFKSFIQKTNDAAYNITAYNNIAHTNYGLHLNDGANSCTNDLDHNLYTGNIQNNCSSNPHEQNGGIKDTPTYDPATFFDPAVNEFSQALAAGSPGYDDGMVLPNFNDGYGGAGPDMGAVEHGQTVIIFGASDAANANNASDNCPSDPFKTAPGICGCGVSDTDSDIDGIPDCNDNYPAVSETNQADSDGDGIGNTCDISTITIINASDSDSDGLINLDEYKLGTDPLDIDTDNDGISDGYDGYPLDDQQSSCLDPIQNNLTLESFTTIQAAIDDPNAVDFDTIQITATDIEEDIFYDRNIILILSGGYNCDFYDNPFKSSINSLTIRSGAIIVDNLVINHDSIPDPNGSYPAVSETNQADSDGDGIGNTCDISTITIINASDSDSDGLINLDEYKLGTDPLDIDTDNDGISDGYDGYPLDDQQSSCLDPIQNNLTLESFTTIQAAIDDPNAVDFDTIQITATDIEEDIFYDRNITLTLSGGYNCNFYDNPFKSSINSLTIRSGAIIVDNLVIK